MLRNTPRWGLEMEIWRAMTKRREGPGRARRGARERDRNGKMLDTPIIHFFHMRDGKMTELWTVGTDQPALDDFRAA